MKIKNRNREIAIITPIIIKKRKFSLVGVSQREEFYNPLKIPILDEGHDSKTFILFASIIILIPHPLSLQFFFFLLYS
jgi:hypothetical protein